MDMTFHQKRGEQHCADRKYGTNPPSSAEGRVPGSYASCMESVVLNSIRYTWIVNASQALPLPLRNRGV
jgi:hypothetical protein